MKRFLFLAVAGVALGMMALVVATPFSAVGFALVAVGGMAIGAGVGLWAITLEGA